MYYAKCIMLNPVHENHKTFAIQQIQALYFHLHYYYPSPIFFKYKLQSYKLQSYKLQIMNFTAWRR
jgi:hypothetical protein